MRTSWMPALPYCSAPPVCPAAHYCMGCQCTWSGRGSVNNRAWGARGRRFKSSRPDYRNERGAALFRPPLIGGGVLFPPCRFGCRGGVRHLPERLDCRRVRFLQPSNGNLRRQIGEPPWGGRVRGGGLFLAGLPTKTLLLSRLPAGLPVAGRFLFGFTWIPCNQ